MTSEKRIPIDGFAWRPDDLLERLRSPELPGEEFWRSMAYALYVMKDNDEFMAALNEVKKQRTKYAFPQQEATTPQNEPPDAPPWMMRQYFNTPKVSKSKKTFSGSLKPKTLKYYLHGNKGGLKIQKHRVLIVFKLFNKWGWIDDKTSANDFDDFFVGEPRHCNITWTANTTILTILMQELLEQPYIEKQTGMSEKSLVEQQFGKTPNWDRSRIDDETQTKIGVVLYILNTKNVLDERKGENYDVEADIQEAFAKTIVEASIKEGQLISTKGI